MLQRVRGTAGPNSTYVHEGMTVDPRWESFENFLVDMGERPEGKTLDRIDGTKGYCKDNCRWATPLEQAWNRSQNKLTPEQAREIRQRRQNGERGVALAREFGVSDKVISDVYRGRAWSKA